MSDTVRTNHDKLNVLLERESAESNKHSPGQVQDSEVLLRTGFSPESINSEGKVQKNAIPARDLINRGLSCDRKSHASPEAIRARMLDQVTNESTKDKRVTPFIYELPCMTVRHEITDDFNNRMNVVLDTSEPNNIAHSSILSALDDEAQARKIRSKFYPYVLQHQPLDTYLKANFPNNTSGQTT